MFPNSTLIIAFQPQAAHLAILCSVEQPPFLSDSLSRQEKLKADKLRGLYKLIHQRALHISVGAVTSEGTNPDICSLSPQIETVKKRKRKIQGAPAMTLVAGKSCCRLCLAPDNECVSIFKTQAADKLPIQAKIAACVQIQVSLSWHLDGGGHTSSSASVIHLRKVELVVCEAKIDKCQCGRSHASEGRNEKCEKKNMLGAEL